MGRTLIKGDIIESLFAQNYVKNGLNGNAAYKAVRPNSTTQNAHVQSSRMLNRESVISKIRALLPLDVEDMEVIRSAYLAKRSENINWSELHKYVSTSLQLKGYLDKEGNKLQQQVNVQLVVEN